MRKIIIQVWGIVECNNYTWGEETIGYIKRFIYKVLLVCHYIPLLLRTTIPAIIMIVDSSSSSSGNSNSSSSGGDEGYKSK